MKPRFVFRRGRWYCAGCNAWGAGRSIAEAWETWLFDWGQRGIY